jgi:hypothetical protein
MIEVHPCTKEGCIGHATGAGKYFRKGLASDGTQFMEWWERRECVHGHVVNVPLGIRTRTRADT